MTTQSLHRSESSGSRSDWKFDVFVSLSAIADVFVSLSAIADVFVRLGAISCVNCWRDGTTEFDFSSKRVLSMMAQQLLSEIRQDRTKAH